MQLDFLRENIALLTIRTFDDNRLSGKYNFHDFLNASLNEIGLRKIHKLIINGLSFSTTADFSSVAKSDKRGTFIGEETGGGYYGNTSGETIKVELPNSKISIIIPKFKYINDVKASAYKDRGVIPDYIITPTIGQILLCKDVQLAKAIDMASGKVR